MMVFHQPAHILRRAGENPAVVIVQVGVLALGQRLSEPPEDGDGHPGLRQALAFVFPEGAAAQLRCLRGLLQRPAQVQPVLTDAFADPGGVGEGGSGLRPLARAPGKYFQNLIIADPLIGSVHDPIYQGAGHLGTQGVPQPKPGAVSKAHGGVLFLDEIGELHPIQMNKLLKVLEDRKVMLESAYYNPEDSAVPRHIHDIFKKGLPADFRLVGATTRSPEEISPALRSRCMEIFFRALTPEEIASIASGAAERAGYTMDAAEAATVGRYASCGREAVNIVQMCAGLAQLEERKQITAEDVCWVVQSGHYAMRPRQEADKASRVGCVHGLAVAGTSQGMVMDIEAVVTKGSGEVTVTGIVEEEELGQEGHRMRRKSTARGSADNVKTLLAELGYTLGASNLHINFPGGMPVDGPSAGVAMMAAAVSALTGQPVDGTMAVTGEISVQGRVKPVGGVPAKVEAARLAGLSRVLVPEENREEVLHVTGIEVCPVSDVRQALQLLMPGALSEQEPLPEAVPASTNS